MDNYELIDMYIDKLVLYFNTNQETSNIIKKLSSLYGKDVIATDCGLEYNGPNITTKIEIDEKQGTIDVIENGKKYGFDNQYFINDMCYDIKNGTGSIVKSSVDYETELFDNGYTITNENILLFYKFYEDNKCTISTIQNIKTKKDPKTGLTKETIFQKTDYVLASGDEIQVINKNGNIDYYCLIKTNDLGTEDSYNRTKITEEEFNRLISHGNNIYNILNDKAISKIRKRF